jgi:hypothetical protein
VRCSDDADSSDGVQCVFRCGDVVILMVQRCRVGWCYLVAAMLVVVFGVVVRSALMAIG